MILDGKAPSGPLETRWGRYRDHLKLLSPNNKRRYTVIVVGTGLAGGSASATLAGLGYNVLAFCYQDSARRAHSIAAQGGINAAKNYVGDGDSVYRLFYETIKGGDFRSRESNVYRLAEVSGNIIDQCVAQGVPFQREYSGELSTRSFGGALVSRTLYCRGQTGQQLLLGCYQAMMHEVGNGGLKVFPKKEMLDLVLVDGEAKGILARDLTTGKYESYAADAVVIATGGYATVFNLSTNAVGSNAGAITRCYKKGALMANPCFTQIHPTCIPFSGWYQSKLILMSESLRNDGRVWVPTKKGDSRPPSSIPESERDYYLERKYPSYGNLAPRDISSRAAKALCDEGMGVGQTGNAVYLDFRDAIQRLGRQVIEGRYGNLFELYEHVTGEDPYSQPMKIYPAPHYAMGGLWVDYNLMSNIPGLFVIGEANFSDHGANRLGASALMQGLADGYFVLPYTIGDYLATTQPNKVKADHIEFTKAQEDNEARIQRLMSLKGQKTVFDFRMELGRLLWENVGMARNEESLTKALQEIPKIREAFWNELKLIGSDKDINQQLERAWRLAEAFDFAEILVLDALERRESCGAHFRLEYQTPDGEALRNDEEYSYVAAWEYQGEGKKPLMHKESLSFEVVKPTVRSYK